MSIAADDAFVPGAEAHPPAPSPGTTLHTQVVRDAESFTCLREAWELLYDRAPRATPFQTHAWLDAWWRAYGGSTGLRVFLVWDGDRLGAAAPCHLVRMGPARVLAPLGGAISDFTDVLVEERDRDSSVAVSALVASLVDEPGWDVLDLPEVRAGAAVELIAGIWPTPVERRTAATCMELPVTDFGQLLMTLPTKRAREVRRVLRRSDELDLQVSDVPPDEVATAVGQLLRLHAEQWQGRGGNPEHQRPRYADHLARALTAMVGRGEAAVVRYVLEGRELAGQIVLVGHDLLGGYLLGVAPELYTRMDFSSYVVRSDVTRALANGCSTYSMLRGEESYKERWLARPAVNSRLLLRHPSRPLGRGYLGAVRLRARLAEAAKERAPWLSSLRRRVRAAARR